MQIRSLLKKIVHPIYDFKPVGNLINIGLRFTWNSRPVRKYWTRNFTSGLLAVGEQNKYCISPEWITIDMDEADFNYDLRDKLPFPFDDGSMSLIFSSHMVEHLDKNTCQYFFDEAQRLLNKGGTLRVETPNLELLIEAYKHNDTEFFVKKLSDVEAAEYGKTLFMHDIFIGLISCYIEDGRQIGVKIPKQQIDEKIEELSAPEFAQWCISFQTKEQRITGGHIQAFYYDRLVDMLTKANFSNIAQVTNGVSGNTQMTGKLSNIEREHRANYSVYVEATK